MRPNDLIHWEGIHWAAHHGFREYDFGEVPEGDVGLARFKSKWGAEERPLYRYYYPQATAKGTDSSVLSTQQKLWGEVWQHLPLCVTAHLGDLIYGYL
jgi:lipid II:glycine glycyltransferase (peptidoglycan interpeptide bridge formation enzyme)